MPLEKGTRYRWKKTKKGMIRLAFAPGSNKVVEVKKGKKGEPKPVGGGGIDWTGRYNALRKGIIYPDYKKAEDLEAGKTARKLNKGSLTESDIDRAREINRHKPQGGGFDWFGWFKGKNKGVLKDADKPKYQKMSTIDEDIQNLENRNQRLQKIFNKSKKK